MLSGVLDSTSNIIIVIVVVNKLCMETKGVVICLQELIVPGEYLAAMSAGGIISRAWPAIDHTDGRDGRSGQLVLLPRMMKRMKRMMHSSSRYLA